MPAEKGREDNIRKGTYAVSGNVDSFENHVESLQSQKSKFCGCRCCCPRGWWKLVSGSFEGCVSGVPGETSDRARVKKVDAKRRSISSL